MLWDIRDGLSHCEDIDMSCEFTTLNLSSRCNKVLNPGDNFSWICLERYRIVQLLSTTGHLRRLNLNMPLKRCQRCWPAIQHCC